MKFKAVIFDFDGLMVDTETIWRKYFFEANEKFNVNFTEEDRQDCSGRNEKEIRKLLKKNCHNLDVDTYRTWIGESVTYHIENIGVDTKAGLKSIIEFLKQNNIDMAIASGSNEQRMGG